jgi:hypothetical protein
MRQQYKLIYIGILKFGFSSKNEISVLGLVDFIDENRMELDQEPRVSINREYSGADDDYFWDLEWWNGSRCLVVYFDRNGCHYQTITCPDNTVMCGRLEAYSDFTSLYKWLSTTE